MAARSKPVGDTAARELVITRVFNAPRELVFKVWTDPKHIARWWGPRMFTNSVTAWDARPGGRIHLDMVGPDGSTHPMGGEFHEVAAPTKLVFTTTAMMDAKGNHQLEVHNTVTFAEHNGKTTLTLRAVVVKAAPEVAGALLGMSAGWSQSLDKLDAEVAGSTDRELVFLRMFDAPRELVFDAWTNPEHVGRWWGPNGFSTTTRTMDVKPGGIWQFVMHGPDGRDYQNRITYEEVTRPERLVYSHGGGDDVEPVQFRVTVSFDGMAGKTILTMRMVFPSVEERERVVKQYGAEEGANQTLARLDEHIAETAKEAFVVTRTFDAPRELVFKAWTESEHLSRWFGPGGSTRVARNDLHPGGVLHYAMQMPGGQEMWGKWVYTEISPPERLVFVQSFSDPEGNTAPSPFHANWPLEVFSVVTFAETGGKTTVTLQGFPVNATGVERKAFTAMHGGMQKGWAGVLDQLEALLAKM